MSLLVLQGAVEQGFIYALVALGLYISFRTLDIADLTTDGTFTLGAAVSAVFTVQGQPLLGVVLAFFCGALAGFVTALLQTKLGVQPILAGIITMTALYSVNLMVMGKPNINFFKEKTIFTAAEAMPGGFGSLLQAAAITAVLCVLLVLFLRTQLGLSLRATGLPGHPAGPQHPRHRRQPGHGVRIVHQPGVHHHRGPVPFQRRGGAFRCAHRPVSEIC